MKTLMKLRDNVESNLEDLAKKTDLTPNEVKTATEAVCLIEKIDKLMHGDKYDEETSEGHRMMHYYPDTAYSYGWDMGPGRVYSHGHDRYMDTSEARGRDAMTGRYVSREMRPMSYDGRDIDTSGRRMRSRMSYDGGYSGHSIDDRIIDQLEHMMDSAQSEYEVRKLNQIIRVVESMKGE